MVIDTGAIKKKSEAFRSKALSTSTYVTPDGKYAIAGSVAGKILTVLDKQTLQIAWSWRST